MNICARGCERSKKTNGEAVPECSSHIEARHAEQDAHVGQMHQELVQAWYVLRHEEKAEAHAPHRATVVGIAEVQQRL